VYCVQSSTNYIQWQGLFFFFRKFWQVSKSLRFNIVLSENEDAGSGTFCRCFRDHRTFRSFGLEAFETVNVRTVTVQPGRGLQYCAELSFSRLHKNIFIVYCKCKVVVKLFRFRLGPEENMQNHGFSNFIEICCRL
jgi:hypothetical protein